MSRTRARGRRDVDLLGEAGVAYGAGRWPAGTYWVLALVAMVLVLTSFATAIHPWTHQPAGAAARFVPVDGTRLPVPGRTPGQQDQPWWENAVVPAEFVAGGMPAVALTLLRQVLPQTPHVVRDWSWWRSTLHAPGSGESTWQTRLFRVDDRKIDWTLTYDTDGGEAFDPAITVIPEDPDADREWTTEGTLTRVDADGSTTADYSAHIRWDPAGDPALVGRDCRAATIELTVATAEREPRRLVFCPEVGLVADLVATEQLTVEAEPRRPPHREPLPPVTTWAPHRWTVQRTTPASLAWPAGAEETVNGGLVRPVQTAGGVLVRGNNDQALFGLVPTPDGLRVDWVVAPGDRILSLRAIGRVLVVTTGDRRVVGYDERGQWLWEVSLADVVQHAAEPVSADTFVVAAVDGGVELRELATGALRWRADVGSTINAVAADPHAGTVHVIDDTGTLTEFGAASPEPRWAREVAAGRAQLVSGGGGVTVLLPNALHRLRDGREVWSTSLAFANLIDGDDRLAYVVADRRLRAYELDTGTVRWSRPGVRTVTVAPPGSGAPGAGDQVAVVVADGTAVLALDGDGAVLAEALVTLHSQGRLVPLADGVLVHWAPSVELTTWEHRG